MPRTALAGAPGSWPGLPRGYCQGDREGVDFQRTFYGVNIIIFLIKKLFLITDGLIRRKALMIKLSFISLLAIFVPGY
jgi:hypothetical protein